MKVFRASLLAAAALLLASCYYYDPYYNASAGISYGDGYADSYGFTGGGVSFVYTSSSRWFYDPGVRCYYDRYRSCYYDPWLGGYYPRNYCPRPIYNCPHPYGWNGRGACPLPRQVHSGQIHRYKERVHLLKQRNYAWAEKVREQNGRGTGSWQTRQARNAANFSKQPQQRGQGSPSRNQARSTNRDQPQLNHSRRSLAGQRSSSPSSARNPGQNRLLSPSTPLRQQSQVRPSTRSSQTRARKAPQMKRSQPSPSRSRPPSRPGYNQAISTKTKSQPSARTTQARTRSASPTRQATRQPAPQQAPTRSRPQTGRRR